MWTTQHEFDKNPRDEPLRARAISLCLVGHHPIHSRAVIPTAGAERFLYVRLPALSTTRPLGLLCLPTNELLSKWRNIVRTQRIDCLLNNR
jgi:hypothetical protein